MKKKETRYYVALFISILGLIAMISGSSYALIKGKISSSKQQVIKSGNLELTLIEHFKNMNNPLTTLEDKDGLLQETVYSFDVKNTGSGTAKYNLKLVNGAPSSYNGIIMDDKYIKIGLEINGEEKGPYTLSELNNMIDKEEIYKGEKVSYKLRIWLNNSKQKELKSFSNSKAYLKLELEIEQSMAKKPIDNSGANEPLLTDNMIPVYYDETNNVWKKADKKNVNIKYKWYDYNDKMWANAVTVTETNRSTYLNAKEGTTIPMSDINTMWVWIPRYTYTHFNTNTPEEIQIKFDKGTTSAGTISCKDTATGTSSTSEVCTDTKNGRVTAETSTYTHPAFWWDKNDNNIRETGEELTGFWMGKFELSTTISCTPNDGAQKDKSCNLSTIKPQIKPSGTTWRAAQVGTFFTNIYKMRESGNQYGFNTTDETHMMKNMEWGAVAYLSHSKYGRCTDGTCERITQNNCSNFLTGIGANALNESSNTTVCISNINKYNGARGVLASTTGNVYGVYDMSGGASELVMGVQVNANGEPMSGYNIGREIYYNNSGFTGYLYEGGQTTLYYDYPSKRYYDKYSNGAKTSEFTRGKLGDATIEMAPSGISCWYSNNAAFPFGGETWVGRGGTGGGSVVGTFFFGGYNGAASKLSSSRATISNLK